MIQGNQQVPEQRFFEAEGISQKVLSQSLAVPSILPSQKRPSMCPKSALQTVGTHLFPETKKLMPEVCVKSVLACTCRVLCAAGALGVFCRVGFGELAV